MLLQRRNIKEGGNVDEGVPEDQIVRDKYDKILLCEVETDVTQTYDSLCSVTQGSVCGGLL